MVRLQKKMSESFYAYRYEVHYGHMQVIIDYLSGFSLDNLSVYCHGITQNTNKHGPKAK